MLPDADKMIADLPGALRRKCLDAVGGWHDCVITQLQTDAVANEYGVEERGATDILYVAKPFPIPEDKRLVIEKDGETTTRRVAAIVDNIVFYEMSLTEEVQP